MVLSERTLQEPKAVPDRQNPTEITEDLNDTLPLSSTMPRNKTYKPENW